MGKDKVKKRITLLREFIISYVLIILFSLITAIVVIFSFYMIYHNFSKEDNISLENPKLTSLIEYISQKDDNITDTKVLRELDRRMKENNMDFYLRDMDKNIVYSSVIGEVSKTAEKISLWNRVLEIAKHSFHNSSDIQIPIFNNKTGQISYILNAAYCNSLNSFLLICIDIGVPFICFLIYTYIFSRRLSRKIKTPLQELMAAVENIKNRNVDFSIHCNQKNEIGDLAMALEELRHELENSLIREWKLEQDRRDMVASITHDIQTPLAIILGHAEGLQEGLKHDSEKLDSYLEIITQNVKRAKKLIDDMNTLAEVDDVGFTLCPSAVDLHSFISNKIDELKILTQKKKINLESEIIDHRQKPGPVLLDSSRISHIIENIIGNSIRFTPEGGNIYLKLEITEETARFTICDNGSGFSETNIHNVFKKFYKGDNSRSLEKGHSGLGLYIAKAIIAKHGGTVNVANLPEGGACVEFSIPIDIEL